MYIGHYPEIFNVNLIIFLIVGDARRKSARNVNNGNNFF